MQMLQSNASPAACGQWGPALPAPHCTQHGWAHPEGRIISVGHPVPRAGLGLFSVVLATGAFHHDQGVEG